jgi:hypothetical protein
LTYSEQEKIAINKIIEIINEQQYEYADNFRAAPVNNPEKWAIYKSAFNDGCCGFYDDSIIIDNIQWDIGFNYGH